ncbi:hypothetical protein VNI00_018432 [Paramarasmius palmivorus]|uniref:Alpha-galactosidase n=1 Tax=Paramarasmius palmivorus TaxID=297713 RepID=A0AAW0AXJ9_9AGAR
MFTLTLTPLFVALALVIPSRTLENGVGKTPAMGWNPYNVFSCGATEAQYRSNAQKLVDLGLKQAGLHVYLADHERLRLAGIVVGKAQDAIHQAVLRGIQLFGIEVWGLFGCTFDSEPSGYFSCDDVNGSARWIGSLNFEDQDAETFASWGADYLKYDNCYAVSETDFVDFDLPFELKPRFTKMRDSLAATGRTILYSACEWGLQDPARWPGITVANSWRMSNDIGPPATWDNLFRIINQVVPITGFTGPGGFNDLDMLYVGNSGLTAAEQQTHFSFWAAAKSPLFIGIDITRPESEIADALEILKNERVIAVNQDSLGKSISFKRRYTNDSDIWAGPLSDGSTVVLIINLQTSSRMVTLNLADVGFSSANAQDLVTGNDLGRLTDIYATTLAGHGSMLLKLSSGSTVSPPDFTFYPASSGTLSGGANTRDVNGTTIVGFIGNGGKLTLDNLDGGSSGGTKLLAIDYINAEWTMSNTACSNCRQAMLRVNGGEEVRVQMPLSGQSWDIVFQGYLVSVPGFRAGKTNTLEIYNPSAYTPDFVRVGIAV